MHLDHIHSPSPTPPRSTPISLLLVFSFSLSPRSNYTGEWGLPSSVVNKPRVTLLKSTDSPSPSSYQILQM